MEDVLTVAGIAILAIAVWRYKGAILSTVFWCLFIVPRIVYLVSKALIRALFRALFVPQKSS